ncbi:two-component system response regulator [Amycolatopsis mediterranei S699]|uniref:Two-component system response regulator n=2 Tax=Amycolatopsis mediterranei TaxID=33910 RepID=A0A0H3D3Y9_AMYMU|nr:response regulator transcription factor [Amycolatopsis mediterranei]ADJ45366.1 two-component system response regulator [Amycolatopsis mediterranei U32]AEK42127.1 two-component system response regulator [Amycolatopsis mediterranei S699]AFO77077.1 two-component system response regulator [Amycolatopsis mediterranei S699]AGT84205.1 two-component system response regulator [Amycolatopsis mediterranei RB]KDO05942.1 transcriptional regulator [Amycolatopsis mediterranei]
MDDPAPPRVLVIEDAEAIRVAVESALADAGFSVRSRPDGAELEGELVRTRPDLVVLDVLLPGRDGFELLRVIRRTSAAGVVMLTARDGVEDRLRGLGEGADDYVVKPFVLAELVARVTAVLRRTGRTRPAVEVGDLVIDVEGGRARYGDADVELTSTEWKVLLYFAQHRDRVVSKTQVLTAVWGYGDSAPNLVEVNVSTLRRKLEAHGPRVLHTVRGQGYVLRGEP